MTDKVNKSQTYTVWVGGVPDVEDVDIDKALKVLRHWLVRGYDDAVIEITNKKSHTFAQLFDTQEK